MTTRDEYATTMRYWSERIIGAVHDDGPDELFAHIRAALAVTPAIGVDPVVALVTVLAAQVDPDTTASQRLAWIETTDPAEQMRKLRVHAARPPAPKRSRKPLMPCGTPAAYKRHRRHGQVPCRACVSAYSALRQQRVEARRAA